MASVISRFSVIIILSGGLAVMLALGAGYLLPHGEQLLFSSAHNWQGEDVDVYALDMPRNLTRPVFISRKDNVPGLAMVWSPDGERVAYVRDTLHLQTNVLDFQTMRASPLADQTDDLVFNTEWSPDSRWLAFIGIRDGESGLYLADADGSNIRKLTSVPSDYKNLAWSPDSTHIVLEMGRFDEDILVVDIANDTLTTITQQPSKNIRPAFSPGGQQIAFLSSRDNLQTGGTRFDLYVANIACEACPPRRLTQTYPADSTWQIRWSPDGRYILMGSTDWSGGDDIIWVEVATGITRNVTDDKMPDGSPVWSPDGQQFAYESRHDGYWGIYLASADGQQRTRITGDNFNRRWPVWSPDGKQLAFIADPQRNWDIYLLDVAAGAASIRRLTHDGSIDFLPIWRPS